MKKIALTLAAVAALGVAACTNQADEANSAENVSDLGMAENEAMDDVNVAANDAAAVNEADDALDNSAREVGEAVENTAKDLNNSAKDVGNAVEDAVD